MKILQIAYYYPPMGGAGVQRGLKFSKYLGGFGIETVVLAGLDAGYVQDASLVAEVPADVRVHRIADDPALGRWAARWRKVRASRHSPSAQEATTASPATARAASSAARAPLAGPRMADRLRDVALTAYATLQFPDDKAAWARRAEVEALRLLKNERFDLVFSSSPPVSAHALGCRLARAAGLPWVADFRDLWTDNPAYALPAWRRALDRHRESGWLRTAAGVVTVTPSWQRMLAERIGDASRVAFIPNGYDEADFAGLGAGTAPPTAGEDRPFRLVHTGTFYGPRDPGALLAGVDAWLRRPGRSTRPLRLRLVGNMGSRFEAALARFDADHPGVVERVAYLPHRAALAELAAADALLLVVGGSPGRATSGWLPGKVFEYLRADRPILVLGDAQGDCADLVRSQARSWIVDDGRTAAIADAVEAMVGGATPALPPTSEVGRFERRRLTGELADFLRRCAGRSARHG